MLTPAELGAYIKELREAGVIGRVKLGDIEVTITPDAPKGPIATPKSLKADYDKYLFAATEGIPDEEST